MAVPKRRTSRSKTRMRRAHDAVKGPKIVYCSQCGSATLPHRVCEKCGHLHGKPIIQIEES